MLIARHPKERIYDTYQGKHPTLQPYPTLNLNN